MKKFRFRAEWLSVVILLVIATISSCKEEDPEPTPPQENPYLETNNWIYDVMDEVYYWTDDMPADPDLSLAPEDFFESLKSDEDRFSVIVANYDDLINSLEGVAKEAGYEFVLFRDGDTNVIAAVLYVKNGSPAEDAGLVRGDIITAINGTTLTLENYQDVLGDISSDHTVTYEHFNEESLTYEAKGDLSLSAVELQEDPNYLHDILTVGTHKVGYFVYTFFSPGPGSTSDFDDEMDNVFSEFKSEGITDLVIDLRYNSGGAVASAVNLASLVAPGVSSSDVFYENRWNDLYTEYWNDQADGDDILFGKFADKAANVGSLLNGQTVYILTGTRTASASELIINGLSPYMNVVTIGETTIGKNVGSVPIQDTDNAENTYGLLPIVFRVYNSAGQSDYSNGFTPVGENFIEEYQQFPLEPLGDPNDPLLARALELLSGESSGGTNGRKMTASALKVQGAPLKSSLDDKPWSNRLILDPALLKK